MSSPCVLSGGSFQDAEGNLLANGYLEFVLDQDASVGGLNICAGIAIRIPLDSSANASGSIWGNDVLAPINTFYRVTGFTAAGQPAWGPNNQTIQGSTFNLGMWVPNQVLSWFPTGAIVLPQFTVSQLSTFGGVEAQLAYATDGRKVGEGSGSGTGVPVYFSNGDWRVYSTDAQVQS